MQDLLESLKRLDTAKQVGGMEFALPDLWALADFHAKRVRIRAMQVATTLLLDWQS